MNPSPTPTLSIDDRGIGWICFDDPDRKLNILTEPVLRRLADVVEEARLGATTGRIRVVVVHSGKPDSFIAGADLDTIAAVEDPRVAEALARLGQAIFMEVETLPVPTVAAIHGICVGGATELALSCRHRVVSDSPTTRIGLPEVQLGFLPSWGGTTRLPRLVGLQAALDLLLTGKQIDAARARRIGFAGHMFPAELFLEEVTDFALACIDLPAGASIPRRGLGTRLLDDTAPGRKVVLAAARKKVLARTGGRYPAPLRILDVLGAGLGRSVTKSLDAEARAAAELLASSVSKNLVHVFRMREAARKQARASKAGRAPGSVEQIGVLGAGVMGGGIAQLAAYHGIRVRMKDVAHEAVNSGLQHARSLFDEAVAKRHLQSTEARHRMELVSGGLDFAGFGAADLVVEAVPERLDLKREVLAEVEAKVSESCILATNTSSLSVDAMAGALSRPRRFCGVHFFHPVHRMPLVEVVRGARTATDVVGTVCALALRLRKIPVVVQDGPGFLVNRILAPYLNEAAWLLAEGVAVQHVDAAARAFGMPMGPLRLIDEVGIEVSAHAGAAMADALGERLAQAPPLVALAASGRPGRKGGRGFYRYENGKERGVDESVYADLGDAVPPSRRRMDALEIRRRLVTQMINEAARALDENIVATAGELDLALILGTGFPPFRGGLLRFADAQHPRAVLDRIRALQTAHGARFEPSPVLEDLARTDRRFYDVFGS